MIEFQIRSRLKVRGQKSYPTKKLEAFFAVLITTMAISFGFEYGVAKPDQAEVIYGILV